jgi:hypothetical protein
MTDRIPGAMTDIVLRLFAHGEAFDTGGFIDFFSDQPMCQFGNAAACQGKEAIRACFAALFGGLQALYHDIRAMWEVGDVVFVEMDVTYWRKDGSSVTLPCADLFRFDADKIQEFRVFMDASPVFNPALPVGADASVMTQPGGRRITPPGIMRRYFAELEEGRRAAGGLAPTWSTAGPRWKV